MFEPGLGDAAFEFFQVRHAQHTCGVQAAYIPHQLIGRGALSVRAGMVVVKHLFVSRQVLGDTFAVLRQYGFTDAVEGSQFLIGIHG